MEKGLQGRGEGRKGEGYDVKKKEEVSGRKRKGVNKGSGEEMI